MHFVSDGSRELTGYCPDELEYNRFTSLEQITHPDDRLRVRQSIGQAVRGNGRYRVQYRILHRNGTEKWVLERGAAVLDESGKRVLEGFLDAAKTAATDTRTHGLAVEKEALVVVLPTPPLPEVTVTIRVTLGSRWGLLDWDNFT